MDAWRAGTYLVLYQLTRGESAQTTDGSRLVFHQMKEEEGPFKLHLLRDAQYKGSFQLRRSVQREEGSEGGTDREEEEGEGTRQRSLVLEAFHHCFVWLSCCWAPMLATFEREASR